MALQQRTFDQHPALYRDLLRVLLIAVAAIVVIVAMTVVFGLAGTGPSLQIIPDPAGVGLPF